MSILEGWYSVVQPASVVVQPGSEMSPARGVAIPRSRAIKVLLHFLQIFYPFSLQWPSGSGLYSLHPF